MQVILIVTLFYLQIKANIIKDGNFSLFTEPFVLNRYYSYY